MFYEFDGCRCPGNLIDGEGGLLSCMVRIVEDEDGVNGGFGGTGPGVWGKRIRLLLL